MLFRFCFLLNQNARQPRRKVGQHLVHDRPALVGDLLRAHRAVGPLNAVAVNDDLLADLRVRNVAQVDHAVIHADIADHRAAVAADRDEEVVGKRAGEPIGKTERQHADERILRQMSR